MTDSGAAAKETGPSSRFLGEEEELFGFASLSQSVRVGFD